MTWGRRGRQEHIEVGAERPRARSEELVVEELDDTLLIYDLKSDHAHSLSADAARVWRCCDGNATVEALGAEAGVDAETAQRALAELEACRLLESAPRGQEGSTRREATVKLARLGAAAASVPLIASIAAPGGAQAAVGCSQAPCVGPGDAAQAGPDIHPCQGSGCICCFSVNSPGCTVDLGGPFPIGCCVPQSLCATA